MHNDWSLIVLAAGKGTRMGGSVPKPLVILGGKPLISPIIENALKMEFKEIIVIISEYTRDIKNIFPDPRIICIETEPLGTGHAALAGLDKVTTANVLVVNADDSYFYTQGTLERLIDEHEKNNSICTVGIMRTVERLPYAIADYSDQNKLLCIKKSSDDLQLPPPKYIVTGLYAFRVSWLIPKLKAVPANSRGEVSLPPVIDYGLLERESIFVFHIPEGEWFGINTPEELERARQLISR